MTYTNYKPERVMVVTSRGYKEIDVGSNVSYVVTRKDGREVDIKHYHPEDSYEYDMAA